MEILGVFHKKYFAKPGQLRKNGTPYTEKSTFMAEKHQNFSVPSVSVTPLSQPGWMSKNRKKSFVPGRGRVGDKAVKTVDKPEFSTLSTGFSTEVFWVEKWGDFWGGLHNRIRQKTPKTILFRPLYLCPSRENRGKIGT